jgi:hypothetical protein
MFAIDEHCVAVKLASVTLGTGVSSVADTGNPGINELCCRTCGTKPGIFCTCRVCWEIKLPTAGWKLGMFCIATAAIFLKGWELEYDVGMDCSGGGGCWTTFTGTILPMPALTLEEVTRQDGRCKGYTGWRRGAEADTDSSMLPTWNNSN